MKNSLKNSVFSKKAISCGYHLHGLTRKKNHLLATIKPPQEPEQPIPSEPEKPLIPTDPDKPFPHIPENPIPNEEPERPEPGEKQIPKKSLKNAYLV